MDDFTNLISDRTWLNIEVREAVSSCMPSDILYILRPSGVRIRAAMGKTMNIINVIFQFKYSSTAMEPIIDIIPLKKFAKCSEIKAFITPVSFVILLTDSPVW
ncbi:hypothetical protein D3C73_1295020 [compost metagenome]